MIQSKLFDVAYSIHMQDMTNSIQNGCLVFTLCRINVIAMISVTDLIFMYFDYSNLKCLISTNFELIQLTECEVGNTNWKANEKQQTTELNMATEIQKRNDCK